MDTVTQAVLAEGERAVDEVRALARSVVDLAADMRAGAVRTRDGSAAIWSSRAASAYDEQRGELVSRTLLAAGGCDDAADALARHAVVAQRRLDELRLLAARAELARQAAVEAAEAVADRALRAGGEGLREVVQAADAALDGALDGARDAAAAAERTAETLGRRLWDELPSWAVRG